MIVSLNNLRQERKDIIGKLSKLNPPKDPIVDTTYKISNEELESGSVTKNTTVKTERILKNGIMSTKDKDKKRTIQY